METEQWWVEVRRWHQRTGKPYFVELGEDVNYQGFRSVYAYDTKIKNVILESRTTEGLDYAHVYSDTLFLDFDNCDATDAILNLYDNRYGFSVWHSGNRSVHLHVPLVPMVGVDVPWSQRQWAKDNAPGCDLSFYTHAGQFRLAGTMHEKTGKRKEMVRHHKGEPLEIPLVTRPPMTARLGSGQAKFMSHLLRPKGEGERSQFVWHLAMLARDEGYPLDDAVNHILWWNKSRCRPPLTEAIIARRCHEVYAKVPKVAARSKD